MAKRIILLIILVVSTFLIFAQKNISELLGEIIKAKQIYEKLEIAYAQNNLDSINQVLVDWNNQVQPNSYDFIHQNDTVLSVFEIYNIFFMPFDLLKLGNWEWGNRLNSGCKYAVVQENINFVVLDSQNLDEINFEEPTKKITNFRPPLNIDKSRILYLSNEYIIAIYAFLSSGWANCPINNTMASSLEKEEIDKRYLMLRKLMPILPGHSGHYWHIATQPEISLIVFNNKFTSAKIYFRVAYQGGVATIEKEDKQWLIKESKSTWIE